MSISPGTTGLSRLVLGLVLGSVAFDLAAAAETEYLPKLDLSLGREGNVAVVGTDRVPDELFRVAFELDVFVATERTSFDLVYQGSQVDYREFTELDYDEHRLRSSLNRRLSPRNDLSLDVSLYSGQAQGIDPNVPDESTALVPRADRDLASIRLGGNIAASERSRWAWDVGGSWIRYDAVSDATLEDSDSFLAGFEYGHGLSSRFSMGGAYDFRMFFYEDSDYLRVHTMSATGGFEVDEFTHLRARLGASRTETQDDDNTSNPSGELVVTRVIAERSRLAAGVSQRVAVGTGLQRGTLDRGGYLAWTFRATEKISLTVHGSYWDSEDLDKETAIEPEIRTFLLSETFTWNLWPSLGIGVYHSFNDQETPGSVDSSLDTTYHSGGVTLRWSPRAR